MVNDPYKVMIEGFKCLRCEYVWVPKDLKNPPVTCPRCRSPLWNRQRQNVKVEESVSMAAGVGGADWWEEYVKVVAEAWSDQAYKERFLHDPRAVLTEAGLEVPSSIELAVMEDSADRRHLVLPAKPEEGEISEEALAGVSGGLCCCCGGPACAG